jgi:uncharacterized protein DUF481
MSRKWVAILTSILIFGIESRAQERDSIYLYNGTVLMGDVKGARLGEVTIDADGLLVMDVKQYRIKTIKTFHRCKIETNEKEIYYGTLEESTKPGWVIIRTDNGHAVETRIIDLSAILTFEKGFIKQLNGNFSAGFSFAKSSNLGQVNFSGTAQYSTDRFDYQVKLSTIGSIDSSRYSRDREDAGVTIAYNLKAAWFIAAGVNYQRNLELSIDRRLQELLGAGNKVFSKKYWLLRAISGLSFSEEKSTDGVESGLLLEIPFILRFDFFKYSHPNIQINASEAAYFGLTQQGRIRTEGNVYFSWELVRRFYLTLNPYASSDNQAPEQNSKFDYGVAVSVSYRF